MDKFSFLDGVAFTAFIWNVAELSLGIKSCNTVNIIVSAIGVTAAIFYFAFSLKRIFKKQNKAD